MDIAHAKLNHLKQIMEHLPVKLPLISISIIAYVVAAAVWLCYADFLANN